MEREYNETNEFKTFNSLMDQPNFELMVIAGRWFEKQIEFAQIKVNLIKPEDNSQEDTKRFLSLILNWSFGNYSLKWFDPQTHSVIVKEITTNAEAELFIFGRLSFLAASEPRFSPNLGIESPCLNFFKNTSISPGIALQDFDIRRMDFPTPLAEALRPSWAYLIPLFISNHWLLLLLYCIASYQFLGLDKKFLEKSLG